MKVMVTGHRPNKLWGYNLNAPQYKKLKTLFKVMLEQYGADTAISGMALGVDTLFAQAVLELKEEGVNIKLICAIPCQNHSSQWFKESIVEYNRIISLADEIVMVSDKLYTPHLMQIRNEWMVNKADFGIAVWDGTSGGTGNCVTYMDKVNLDYIIINPKTVK